LNTTYLRKESKENVNYCIKGKSKKFFSY
jgi:hypothetical protein